jgi:flagellar motor switch protein FliG
MNKEAFVVEDFSPYKKAALLLNGLHHQDKDWILSNLSGSQREKLGALLVEVAEIGFESTDKYATDIVSDFLKDKPRKNGHKKSIEETIGFINMASASSIHNIMQNEVPDVVALLLAINNWSWSSSYMSMLPEESRENVRFLIPEYLAKMPDSVRDAALNYIQVKLIAVTNANN